MRKILTICDGGTVRSVCLARLLKDGQVDGRQHDAVAASGLWNSKGTLAMLCRWANLIVDHLLTDGRFGRKLVPKENEPRDHGANRAAGGSLLPPLDLALRLGLRGGREQHHLPLRLPSPLFARLRTRFLPLLPFLHHILL